jgi:hypothetical protein
MGYSHALNRKKQFQRLDSYQNVSGQDIHHSHSTPHVPISRLTPQKLWSLLKPRFFTKKFSVHKLAAAMADSSAFS